MVSLAHCPAKCALPFETTLHLSRGEARKIGLNIALIVVAAVTVWLATTSL